MKRRTLLIKEVISPWMKKYIVFILQKIAMCQTVSSLGVDCYPVYIRKTLRCDLYPLTPHFYILILGFTGVYVLFFYFCSKT